MRHSHAPRIREVAEIWERVLPVSSRFSALVAAEHIELMLCNVISYLEANTLRQALERKFECRSWIRDRVAWCLDVHEDEAVLRLQHSPLRPLPAPIGEFLIASQQVFLARFGPPNWHLRFVSLRQSEPPDAGEFERIFGVTPRFLADSDQMGFDAALLDAQLRTHNPVLPDLLQHYAGQTRNAKAQSPGVSKRVREILRGGLDPGVVAVAHRLGASVRTLQRALAKEGTSYAEIAVRTRRAAAEHLLRQPGLAISEVACALGFNDVPAFHRAFRRWTGSTPGEFRAQLSDPVARPRAVVVD
jgi:AraC-like DNA-binding protein